MLKRVALTTALILVACSDQASNPLSDEIAVLQLAAQTGDAEAQHRLGVRYVVGEGVARDEQEALKWISNAAKQGHIEAQFQLGSYYTLENSTDYPKAVRWLQPAAEKGHSGAQYSLGTLYFHGVGVKRDFALAYGWLSLALAQGDTEAATVRDAIAPELTDQERATARELYERYQK